MPRVSWPIGMNRIAETRIPIRIASPPSFGVGSVWRLRSFGTSIAPILRAIISATGTSVQAITAATRNA